MKTLVLGGARSGKSRYAENAALNLAEGQRSTLYYLATAQPQDEEMQQRIRCHQQQRDKRWQLIEEPIALAESLQRLNQSSTVILVDCLTLWLSNCLHHGVLAEQKAALLNVLPTLEAHIFLVSNEVGSGIVPMGELSRQFVDESGWLHQMLAQHCDSVTLIVAGLPLGLK